MSEKITVDFEAIRQQQRANDVNFVDAYRLPQLPDDRDDVFDRIVEAELRFGPTRQKNSYYDGTAQVADEVYSQAGKGLLITAEHATARWSPKNKDDLSQGRVRWAADHGTGGLGIVVSGEYDTAFVAPTGKQTGDANSDVEHPLKTAARKLLDEDAFTGHFSLHRMLAGRVASLADMRGYNIMLGVGDSPSEETMSLAEKMQTIAKGYDLRLGINEPVLTYEDDAATPKILADGSYQTTAFSASRAGTTRAFAQSYATEMGMPFSAVQIEISQTNLVLPEDHPRNPGLGAQKLGVYLAYLFVSDCTKLVT